MKCNGDHGNAKASDWAQEPAHHWQGWHCTVTKGRCKQGIISPHNLIQAQEADQHFSRALSSVLVKRGSEKCRMLGQPKLFVRLCGTPRAVPPCPCAHRVKTFPPNPNPSRAHIWNLYHTGMYTELQDSCTVFWTQTWVVYFLWILSNFSLKRNFLCLPLHINVCTASEEAGVQTSTGKHKSLIWSIYCNVRWSVVQKQFSEWMNEDVSFHRIQIILLLMDT